MLRPLRWITPLPAVGVGRMVAYPLCIIDEECHRWGEVFHSFQIDVLVRRSLPAERVRSEKDNTYCETVTSIEHFSPFRLLLHFNLFSSKNGDCLLRGVVGF